MAIRTHLGTIQMSETFLDSQDRWLSHILLGEARSSAEGEERDLVTIVEGEG